MSMDEIQLARAIERQAEMLSALVDALKKSNDNWLSANSRITDFMVFTEAVLTKLDSIDKMLDRNFYPQKYWDR